LARCTRRFVGLLLVTKLLPQGNDAAVQDVLDAVGFAFLQRLLLPLQQQQQQHVDTDKLQQQHLSVVLGLSILSAACRLPDVAGGDDVLQLVPLLLKVAAAGGVAHVLQPTASAAAADQAHQQHDSSSWADPSVEAAAAADALECAVACASRGSYQQSVVLESNGFQAAVSALQAGLIALDTLNTTAMQQKQAQQQQQQQQDSAAAQVAAGLQQVMLSVHLLSLLLGSEAASGAAAQLQQDCPHDVSAAVMLLARVFGGTLSSSSAPGASSSSSSSSSSSGPDLAALQLQAQHALLLLLPLPEDSPAAALLVHAAENAAGVPQQQQQQRRGDNSKLVAATSSVAGDWPHALRQGLCRVMRSRVGVVQRHSALRLAAACLELLGPAWLLPQQQQQQQQYEAGSVGGSAAAAAVACPAEQFLLVLMELLAIETPLLLSDAMNPNAAVPREDIAMPARQPDTSKVSVTKQQQQQQDEAASGDMEVDEQAPSLQQQQQSEALSVQQVLQQVQQQEAQAAQQPANSSPSAAAAGTSQPSLSGQGPPGFQQQQKVKSLQQQLAELQLPRDKAPGPGQQVAGQRAVQCLPSCYQLLEGCLEVLVQQVTGRDSYIRQM
jgi:hypothetical protein